jgi:hypothetical protein
MNHWMAAAFAVLAFALLTPTAPAALEDETEECERDCREARASCVDACWDRDAAESCREECGAEAASCFSWCH